MSLGAVRVARDRATPVAFEIPYPEGTVSRLKSLALALSLIPLCLAAQESPFRGGQWAMQFGGGSSLFSLGVLKFTSPRSAWLLDLATSASILNAKSTDKFGGGTTSADRQLVNFSARLGKRFYQAPRDKVVSFQTLAVEGSLQDQMFDVTAGNVRQTIWSAGLNGEVGGSYMLTPSLSLGGAVFLSAGYFSFKQDDPAATDTGHGYYFNGLNALFALGLYF